MANPGSDKIAPKSSLSYCLSDFGERRGQEGKKMISRRHQDTHGPEESTYDLQRPGIRRVSNTHAAAE